MNDTSRGNRVHLGFFGRRNSGKSSLVNRLTGQQTSIVNSVAGTTTDPVRKNMEIHGIGACVLIDTAGFDDTGELGEQRNRQSRLVARQVDVAVVLFTSSDFRLEAEWVSMLKTEGCAVVAVVSKADLLKDKELAANEVERLTGVVPVVVSALTGEGTDSLVAAMVAAVARVEAPRSVVGSLAKAGDTVLLVMPQDRQAPQGRLIMPQVETIRALLDANCTVVCSTGENLDAVLATLVSAPKLIITDSQLFARVADKCPKESLMTSFSVLLADVKGDVRLFVEGAKAIDNLNEGSRVLVAEACTHAPLSEDIGREKIPAMLRRRVGRNLRVDVVAGADFPDDLSPYNLVIHCGACMFNRRSVLSRIGQAQRQGVPITNYGVAIAFMLGILDRVALPQNS